MQELSARVEAPPVIEFTGPRERVLAQLEKLAPSRPGDLPADGDQEDRS